MPTIVFAQPRVATPTFSTGGGEYAAVVMVTVRVATPGAAIRFTQNGSDPTESDPIVASGSKIAINTSLTLKARAFLNGRRPSQVKTASFKIMPVGSGPPLGPGDAAAAGRRSLLAMPDGRLLAWRRDEAPRLVHDLTNVTAVAASGTHALALTRNGDVYSWGANTEGQLGDGTHVRRERPVRVHGLSNVVRVVAARAHSLALTADGRVWAWGSNAHGQLGIAKTQVRVPTPIPTLSDVIAIDAGDAHSVAVTRTGDVFAWGANKQGQLGDGSRKERRTPVRIGISNVAEIAAGSTHTLAMARDGSVYSWGSGARGELGTGSRNAALRPTLISGLLASSVRAGRHFSAAVRPDGTLMMWGANDSGQLGDGTFVDRSTPTPGASIPAISTLALGGRHSIAVTATGDVWTWGRTAAPTEAMSDVADWGPPIAPDGGAPPPPTDVSPPTIVATVSPAPSAPWFTTPVVVTFECADDSGTVTCPAPVTVSSDGASQVVSGTAVDAAGNQATAAVTVNIDQTPPSIVLTDSPDNTETTATQVLLTGLVSETVSGLAEALHCNAGDVPVVQDAFECVVSLQPGVNHVGLYTSDLAGHFTVVGIAITRVARTTDLSIAPDARTMVIREVAPLSLTDESGATVSGALWKSSNEGIAVVSTDEPPVVTAVAAGTATISASKDGRTAESTIIVSSADALPPGTVRWTVAPTLGFTMQPPIFTHRIDPSVPDMFLVETQTRGEAILRAVTSEGAQLWTQHSPGVPLMGDSFGGVIAGVLYNVDFGFEFRALVRLGEAGGVPPWRYESEGVLLRPAQAPDGTLYAIELVPGLDQFGDRFWDKQAIVIDGTSGHVIHRRPFPRDEETYVAEDDGITCASSRNESTPDTVGPVVGSDGRGYLLIRRRHKHMVDSCVEQTAWPQRAIDNGVDLVMLSRGGTVVQQIHAENCNVARFARADCDVAPFLNQVVPDGIGGVLASWNRGTFQPDGLASHERIVTRRDESGALAERALQTSSSIHIVGQNGIVYVPTEEGLSAIDVRTWTPKWTAGIPFPLAAHPDGGVAIFAPFSGAYQTVNSAGQLEATALHLPMESPVQAFGNWIGVGGAGLVSVAGDFPDATRFSAIGGNAQRQSAERKPGLGIFLKSHLARPMGGAARYRHLSLRVVPVNQQRWQSQSAAKDQFGNWYFTFGAGPVGGDTDSNCGGTLVGGLNRATDVTIAPYDPLESIPHNAVAGDTIIQQLFNRFNAYQNNLPYACFPENNDGFYNSNSYAAGLLNAVALRVVGLPTRVPELFPGVRKPVPSDKFQ